jgi:hypothetical protein
MDERQRIGQRNHLYRLAFQRQTKVQHKQLLTEKKISTWIFLIKTDAVQVSQMTFRENLLVQTLHKVHNLYIHDHQL